MSDARSRQTWELAARQHGIVTRRQMLSLGFSSRSIEHRRASGRLHLVTRGVYAVGWPALDRRRRWMAAVLTSGEDADKRGLVDPATLREELDRFRGEPGVRPLRFLLDELFFQLSDSDLEIYFRRIVKRAKLPMPLSKQRVNRFEVDFFWPGLGLVVETDGLRYHRTPSTQTRDARRDRAHVMAGMTPLRFTHHEVRYEPARVWAALTKTIDLLERRSS